MQPLQWRFHSPRWVLIGILSWGFCLSALAQRDSLRTDTCFIQGNRQGLTVRTRLGSVFQQWEIQHIAQAVPNIRYDVNLVTALGGHVAYNGVGLGFYLRPNEARLDPARYGYSRRFDLSLDLVRQRWYGALIFNSLQGFYLPNPGAYLQPRQDTLPPQIRADMQAQLVALEFMRVFNHRRYSLPALMNQTEVQCRSSGTFLLKGHVGLSQVWADSSLIPRGADSLFPSVAGLTRAIFLGGHLMLGYAHTFVIGQRFAISPFLLAGLGFQRQLVEGPQGEVRRNSLYVASELRLTLNYSRPRWFTGFLLHARMQTNFYEEMRLVSNLSGVQLYLGYRFPDFRIFPKAAWLRRWAPLRRFLDGA